MIEALTNAFTPAAAVSPVDVLLRLAAALVLGVVVGWIYRRARGTDAAGGSFFVTLVLLAVLIAMVTQVIGDNIARAFSLVGALSIVRFRTVVRDTQDTAYLIFAVVVGMAVGAQQLWVGLIGLVVVGVAAWMLRGAATSADAGGSGWVLQLRLNIGLDPAAVLTPALAPRGGRAELVAVETARQGIAFDATYHLDPKAASRPAALLQDLNRIEGVQGVSLKRRETESA